MPCTILKRLFSNHIFSSSHSTLHSLRGLDCQHQARRRISHTTGTFTGHTWLEVLLIICIARCCLMTTQRWSSMEVIATRRTSMPSATAMQCISSPLSARRHTRYRLLGLCNVYDDLSLRHTMCTLAMLDCKTTCLAAGFHTPCSSVAVISLFSAAFRALRTLSCWWESMNQDCVS